VSVLLHAKLSSEAGAEVTVVVALTFLLLETGWGSAGESENCRVTHARA
jgi:hypothetical protein